MSHCCPAKHYQIGENCFKSGFVKMIIIKPPLDSRYLNPLYVRESKIKITSLKIIVNISMTNVQFNRVTLGDTARSYLIPL